MSRVAKEYNHPNLDKDSNLNLGTITRIKIIKINKNKIFTSGINLVSRSTKKNINDLKINKNK